MNLTRHRLVSAHEHLKEACDCFQATLTCLCVQRPSDAARFHDDAVAQLELAAKELGLRIEPATLPAEVSALAQACHDILVKEAGFEIVETVRP